jgi:hypothetical protein
VDGNNVKDIKVPLPAEIVKKVRILMKELYSVKTEKEAVKRMLILVYDSDYWQEKVKKYAHTG